MTKIQCRLAHAFLALTTLAASLYAGDAKNPLASDAGLRQAVERAVYSLKDSGDGSYRGANPKQRLQVEFDEHAARLQHAQGTVSFHLLGYGYGEHLRTPAEAKPAGTPQGVEYRRGELTEWYKNESSGLEQGFTLEHRPGTSRTGEPLIISLAVEGDLRPKLASTGDAVLLESGGKTILRYDGLRSWDARGRAVAGRMEVQERQVRLVVEDQNAEYPLVVDPLAWTQQAELMALGGAAGDEFGTSVSVSGDTAVVGAPFQNDIQGSAYVFVRTGTSWTEQQQLAASDGVAGDSFGIAVTVNGDTAVVGANNTNFGQGTVYVFVRTGTTWTQQAELTAADGVAGDFFGSSVALNGNNTLVVGAPNKNGNQGEAYVFVRSGTTWSQQAALTASDGAAGDFFGVSVAVNRNTAVIGASGKNSGQGAAYVFVQSGTSWSQQAEITAPDGAAGDDFGVSVAVSGDTALVGADNRTVGANASQGAAYVFVRTGPNWAQQGSDLVASDGAAGDSFGTSVALDRDKLVVGAYLKIIGSNAAQGAAYVFVFNGTAWSQQQELNALDGAANDGFGYSVSVNGDTVLVGAYSKNSSQGAAYVFIGPAGPDLTATKTDSANGSTTLGASWTWTISVGNGGNASATFSSGNTILTDNLPNSNITYGTATATPVSGITGTGTISCSIDGSDDLSCTASGGTVIITTNGSFAVSFTATPSATGTFGNPRGGGSCQVDPNAVVSEPNENNPNCTDTVIVGPAAPDLTVTKNDSVNGSTTTGTPWTWTVTVANGGTASASFSDTNVILTDNLPNANITYGSVSPPSGTGISGTINCSIDVSDNLSCTASGPVSIAAGGSFTVFFTATPSANGTFANPRTSGICEVDPNNVVAESNENNNTCSDIVKVAALAPDLTATKMDNVNGMGTEGSPWTWTITVANVGNASATFNTGNLILRDTLPETNITYGTALPSVITGITGTGTIGCAISSVTIVGFQTLDCKATTGTVIIAAGGSFTVAFTATASATGNFVNPEAFGLCAADPGQVASHESNNNCNDSVYVSSAVSGPNLTASKADNVSGATTYPTGWTWTITVTNIGSADATFNSTSNVILSDTLPSGVTYPPTATVTPVSGITGTITCPITSGTLTCTPSGGSATIAANTGKFTVAFAVTPDSATTYSNTCSVDPGHVVQSSSNTCNTDSVVVSPAVSAPNLTVSKTNDVGGSTAPGNSWTWTLKVTNSGNANSTFTTGNTILTDSLPNSNIAYSGEGPGPSSGATGTINCSINGSYDLSCTAGNSVTITPGGYFTLFFTATPSATGTYANPRPGGTCVVPQSGNTCSDTVVVSSATAPEAGSGGTFQVGYVTHLDVGDSFIDITNDGQSQPPSYGIGTSGGTNLCVGVYTFDQNEELDVLLLLSGYAQWFGGSFCTRDQPDQPDWGTTNLTGGEVAGLVHHGGSVVHGNSGNARASDQLHV